ncbi:radical SAM protein [Patescibacteria group bacterium]|nr:radical SAM protein [Patescibacteria group bacterium]
MVKCPFCNWEGQEFLPYGVNFRKNAKCPKCNSLERHRLIYLYLKKILNKHKPLKVLHFAPEKILINLFKSYKNIEYLSADINPKKAMQKENLTHLSFEDNSFDIIICNHVLIYIEEDKKAMKELYRILKPKGFAILQEPVFRDKNKTFENFAITDPKERENIFGGFNHVRTYGKDYISRLMNAGFKVKINNFSKSLKKEEAKKFSLSKEDIYICSKPETKKERYFASWVMTDMCNFNCEYCSRRTKGKINPLPINKIVKTLKKTKKPWIIGMTGGEPFLYPNFVELCQELTKNYKIALDTNLSLNKKVKEFVNTINPERVEYIYISTHILEREKRNEVEEFIKNLLLLKAKKFNFSVNYIIHPTLIKRFKKDYNYFKSKGIKLNPKPLKGEYNGKTYPESYSEQEKRMILGYDLKASTKLPFYCKGMKCKAGNTFILIQPDGTVTRCFHDKTILGNIFQNIQLNKTIKPCQMYKCNCFGYELIEDYQKEKIKQTFNYSIEKFAHL